MYADTLSPFDALSDEESSIGNTDSSASSIINSKTTLSLPEKTYRNSHTEIDFTTFTSSPDCFNTSDHDLESAKTISPLPPPKRGCRLYRNLRWTILTPYIRLWLVAIVANLAVIIFILSTARSRHSLLNYSSLATATTANVTFAVLLRQEHVVNLLFLVSCAFPRSISLRARRVLAKVYTYGGLHSGCAIAATVWFAVLAGLVLFHTIHEPLVDWALATVTVIILCLLLAMIISSHPAARIKFHNSFELIHRFCGWSAVLLFWIETFLIIRYESNQTGVPMGRTTLEIPGFWLLAITTISIIFPWLRLRPMKVRPEPLSDHAIRLHFDGQRSNFGQGFRLSDRPLIENHAFAAIPDPNGANTFSVIVSNAGDWTNRIIRNPPARLWTRGVLQYGAIRVATLFNPVIIVATGSGIAPCMSLFFGAPDLRCRVLWSAPKPLATYGQPILDAVRTKDQEAVIIDTKVAGRPDLVRTAYSMFSETKAEAVVVISNAKVTRKVVYGLEARGVPTFAPIFDS